MTGCRESTPGHTRVQVQVQVQVHFIDNFRTLVSISIITTCNSSTTTFVCPAGERVVATHRLPLSRVGDGDRSGRARAPGGDGVEARGGDRGSCGRALLPRPDELARRRAPILSARHASLLGFMHCKLAMSVDSLPAVPPRRLFGLQAPGGRWPSPELCPQL